MLFFNAFKQNNTLTDNYIQKIKEISEQEKQKFILQREKEFNPLFSPDTSFKNNDLNSVLISIQNTENVSEEDDLDNSIKPLQSTRNIENLIFLRKTKMKPKVINEGKKRFLLKQNPIRPLTEAIIHKLDGSVNIIPPRRKIKFSTNQVTSDKHLNEIKERYLKNDVHVSSKNYSNNQLIKVVPYKIIDNATKRHSSQFNNVNKNDNELLSTRISISTFNSINMQPVFLQNRKMNTNPIILPIVQSNQNNLKIQNIKTKRNSSNYKVNIKYNL